MDLTVALDNFNHPAILFFFLGLFAVAVKSDLEIPPQIGKFLGIYLLFHIGIKGGWELWAQGLTGQILVIILVCLLGSFLVPFPVYKLLRRVLTVPDAGATAASFGSISAVTFVTALSFLDVQDVPFGGYMVAGMALMEAPAIVAGIMLIRLSEKATDQGSLERPPGLNEAVWEAVFNGSVLLLIGSMIIGYVSGLQGQADLAVFVDDIFYGMLSIYMLHMGIEAGRRFGDLKRTGIFPIIFALVFPITIALCSITLCYFLGYAPGDALLQTVLFASASYIAVPAAMNIAVPEANMSIVLAMALCVTFTFNVVFGIPLYFTLIEFAWG